MTDVTLNISGMKCNGCVSNVQRALEAIEGVESVQVSLEQHNAVIHGDVAAQTLATAVTSAGYPAEVV